VGTTTAATRISGHWQVKSTLAGRKVYVLWRDADGRHQKLLGPAWMRDSRRRTPRGAIIWRAGDGPKPSPEYLTPRDADAQLAELLAAAPTRKRPSARARRVPATVSFGDACAEWLRYVEHERRRAPSTLRDYRNAVEGYLKPEFGADTPLSAVTTERVDGYRSRLLQERRLSPRTVQKVLVLLHGICKRAKRRGRIEIDPVADAERVAVKRSGDFNVLSPAEVDALARVAANAQDGALLTVSVVLSGATDIGELGAAAGHGEIRSRLP
jgi:hypothetical protein